MAGIPDALKQRGVHQLFRTTLQGFKRPELALDDATFLLHTTTCTYALDDEGICRDIIPRGDRLPRGVDRCRGAQYVACLYKDSDEGMVGDPRIGGRALFVGRGTGMRMALLKTARITGIEHIDLLGHKRRPTVPAAPRWSDDEIDVDWSLNAPKAAAQTYMMLPKPQLPIGSLGNDVMPVGALASPARRPQPPKRLVPQPKRLATLPPRTPTLSTPKPTLPARKPTLPARKPTLPLRKPAPPIGKLDAPLRPPRP
jgi:hypothetical protein